MLKPSKTIIASSLILAILGCSNNITDIKTYKNSSVKSKYINQKTGRIIVNFGYMFSKNFSLKRFDFNSSEINKVRISVVSVDENGNELPKVEEEVLRSENKNDIAINIPEGKNKVLRIEGLDKNDNNLNTLMASVDVKGGDNTTINLNYGTIPTAKVLYKLIKSNDINSRKIAGNINLLELSEFINKLTSYDKFSNTFGGINPAYIDINSILNHLVTNNGKVPEYKRGTFDKEIKGELKVTVKNDKNEILQNMKITINDLTSNNVSNTNKDITTIENVSEGSWLLKVSGSNNGSVYGEKIININDNNLNQSIEIIVTEPKVKMIEFEELEENIPLPSTLEVSTNQNLTLKAKVTMDDGFTNTSEIDWTSSDTSIATVSNGSINGLKEGNVTIKATAQEDNSKFISVNIKVIQTDSSGPSINSFTPTRSSIGATVIIKGNNFEEDPVKVKFNGIDALITEISDTEIEVTVPNGATTGRITVSTKEGTKISNNYFIVSSVGNTDGMILIPEGKLKMGSNNNDDNDYYPQHDVNLDQFHIDQTEVTNEQYEKFINNNGYTNQNYWTPEGWQWLQNNNITEPAYWNDTRFNRNNQPVVGVSWYEAMAYAKYKNRRLPTEAEWEYASKGNNDTRDFPWGSDNPSSGNKKANGFFGFLGEDDGYRFTSDVGSFESGNSQFGVKDMSGNAYEWISDWYSKDYYDSSPINNPAGPSIGGTKVLRGGSWYNHPHFENDSSKFLDSMRNYYRFFSSPDNRSNYIGFRTAK